MLNAMVWRIFDVFDFGYEMNNNSKGAAAVKIGGIIAISAIPSTSQLKISDVEHAFKTAAAATTKTECKQPNITKKTTNQAIIVGTAQLKWQKSLKIRA